MPLNSASKPSTPFIAFAGGSYANGRETLRATKTRGEHGAARDTEKGNKWEVKSEERERKEERQERRQREKDKRRARRAQAEVDSSMFLLGVAFRNDKKGNII